MTDATKRRTVIHRDRTFHFEGKPYLVIRGSTRGTAEWSGYTVVAVLSDRPGDWATVEEGLWSLSDVRAYLARAEAEGWPYLPDMDGNDPHEGARRG